MVGAQRVEMEGAVFTMVGKKRALNGNSVVAPKKGCWVGEGDRDNGCNKVSSIQDYRALFGGWGGIRTLETLARLPVFKTGAFNHSATHPSNVSITCV